MRTLILVLLAAPLALAETPPEPEVTLLATGDLTPGHHYETFLAERREKDGWDDARAVAYGFERIRRETAGADVFLTNLECPLTWRGEKIQKNFAFRAHPSTGRVLVDGGVDVVSLANNHMYDYGPDGVGDTITALETLGIRWFGAGPDLATARAPAIVERNGLKIAFLGYFFLGDRNIEPEVLYAGPKKPGVAGCFKGDACIGDMVEEDVKAALARADLVVPYFHWGREAQDEVMPYQRVLATRAVKAGAKLVLGAHPHVIHGIEQIDGVPVVYSMGNFIFGGNWNPRVKTALAIRATLTKSGVKAIEAIPMKYTDPPDAIFQPRWLEGAEKDEVLAKLRALSAPLGETIPQLVEQRTAVVGE